MIDPQTAQAIALQWIGVGVAIIVAAITGIATIKNTIETKLTKQTTESNAARLDSHGADIRGILRELPPTSAPQTNTTNIAVDSGTPSTGDSSANVGVSG